MKSRLSRGWSGTDHSLRFGAKPLFQRHGIDNPSFLLSSRHQPLYPTSFLPALPAISRGHSIQRKEEGTAGASEDHGESDTEYTLDVNEREPQKYGCDHDELRVAR